MLPHRVNDLAWGWSGDISIGITGDLKDTSEHILLSFVQEIRTRLQSELYDWKLHPHIGASLQDLIGEPNTKAIAEEGKAKIVAALTKDGLVSSQLIKVRSVPVDLNHILFSVLVSVPDASKEEILNISFLMDTSEYQIIFLK